jgi:hypothetical protein
MQRLWHPCCCALFTCNPPLPASAPAGRKWKVGSVTMLSDWGARPSRSPQPASRRLLSEGNVFGRRPKTAGETPALPEKPRCSGWCSGWICVAKELFADKLLSWRPCARRAGSYHLSLNIVPEHGRRPKIAPSAAPHCRISIRIARSRRVSEPSPGIRVLPARFIRAWLMDGNWVC